MLRALLVVPVALLALGACTPAAAPPTAPSPAPSQAGWQTEMVAAINAQRAAAGRSPVRRCGALDRASQAHSADQAARATMSHTGGDGSSPSQRAGRAGYVGWTALSENVAYGYADVGRVMAGWMGSSGHRTNLLSSSVEHVGVGLARSASGAPYWTQMFGRGGSC